MHHLSCTSEEVEVELPILRSQRDYRAWKLAHTQHMQGLQCYNLCVGRRPKPFIGDIIWERDEDYGSYLNNSPNPTTSELVSERLSDPTPSAALPHTSSAHNHQTSNTLSPGQHLAISGDLRKWDQDYTTIHSQLIHHISDKIRRHFPYPTLVDPCTLWLALELRYKPEDFSTYSRALNDWMNTKIDMYDGDFEAYDHGWHEARDDFLLVAPEQPEYQSGGQFQTLMYLNGLGRFDPLASCKMELLGKGVGSLPDIGEIAARCRRVLSLQMLYTT